MNDFYEWLEKKGRGAVFLFEILVTAILATLFAYLLIVC